MSMKKGLFRVFRTRATRGLAGAVLFGGAAEQDIRNMRAAGRIPARRRSIFIRTPDLRDLRLTALRLDQRVREDRDDDDEAYDDLLQEGRDSEEVETVAQDAHGQGSDQ